MLPEGALVAAKDQRICSQAADGGGTTAVAAHGGDEKLLRVHGVLFAPADTRAWHWLTATAAKIQDLGINFLGHTWLLLAPCINATHKTVTRL